MLVSGLKRIWPAAGLAAVLLLAAACWGQDPAPSAEDTGATPTRNTSAITAPGSDQELNPASESGGYLAPFYKSPYDLVRTNDIVIVGRVTGVLLPCLNRPGYLGQPTYADCALHPEQEGCPSLEELTRPPGRGFTVYSVEIQQVIASDESVRPGDTIGFLQSGGICEDTPPEVAAAYDPQAAYETEYDTMIETGSTYLFFLDPMRTGLKSIRVAEPWGTTYSGPSFGRFLIDADGHLQIVAAFWTCPECGASKALAGKTLAEAETTLRPLIAQVALESTPTPTPTPQPSTPTPTPTPQLGTPTPVSQLDTPTPISP